MRANLAVVIGALSAGAGCTLILGGNRDYREVDAGSGGAPGSTSASTSASSVGGGASSSGSSSSSSSGNSSSGSGGSGAAMCRPLHSAEDCGPGKRCTLVDEVTGTTGCVALSGVPLMPFDVCNNDDTRCPAGTWCNSYQTGVCEPFCASAGDCDGGKCIANPTGKTGKPVPGINVCTAHCDPVGLTPCGTGATCFYDIVRQDFDCAGSEGFPLGASCPSYADCAPKLFCAESSMSMSMCVAWCHPAGSDSPDCEGGPCAPLANQPLYNGVAYGYCM